LVNALRIAFIGVGSTLLFSFVTSALQATQKFWKWSLIQIFTNFLRLAIVITLFYLSKLNLSSTMISYVAMPFIGFVVGIFLMPSGYFSVREEGYVAKEFFSYNKWIAGFTVFASISSRLDTFISARLVSSYSLGIYSVANQLVQVIPQIIGALGSVFAPKMASFSNAKELVVYLKKAQLFVTGFVVLGLLSIPFIYILIPVLYGAEYGKAFPLFIILLLSMLVFLFSAPIHNAVFYYFSYPKLFFWLSIVNILIVAGMGWYMISNFGTTGAALTVLVSQIINFLVPLYWVLIQIKKRL